MSAPGTDMNADAVLGRLRRAEEALAPLVASDVAFIRNGIVPLLVQLRELQAFIDLDAVVLSSVEFE
jgi:hypothetical protein